MQQNSIPVANDDTLTRPARRFEGRRLFWIVILLLFLGGLAFVIIRGCMSPLGGAGVVSAAKGSSVPTATAIAALPVVGGLGGRPSDLAAVDCYMLVDYSYAGGVVPVNSKVSISGFTFAAGGRVFVAAPVNGWVDAGLLKCLSDVSRLERSYFATATVTPTVTPTATVATPEKTSTPQRVYINAPTHTPYPTYTPFPTGAAAGFNNGVFKESADCWNFNVYGVSEIWINGGTPIAGGTVYCDVKEFRVVVK